MLLPGAGPGARGPSVERASLYQQPFVGTYIGAGSSTNAAFSVNRPTEYGSNPIWPTLASTDVDLNVGYLGLRVVGGRTFLFCTAWNNTDVGTWVQAVVAYTDDGHTIVRPTVGQHTYTPLGNANNNIIQPNYPTYARCFTKIHWDRYSQKYVAIMTPSAGLPMTVEIWTSRDLRAWTREKDLGTITSNQYCEPMAFWRGSDGRARIYYQGITSGHASYGGLRRHIGYLLGPSDGSLSGSWTYATTGTAINVLTAPSDDVQYYQSGVHVDGDIAYVMVGIFDGTNTVPSEPTFDGTKNRIHKVQLFTTDADDGTTLTSRDSTWINSSGVYGEWDGGEIIAPNGIAEIGDLWRIFLNGDGNTHHQPTESIRMMGQYSMARRRIGQMTGNGSGIEGTFTSPTITGAGRVMVNVSNNASNLVKLEVLDSGGSVVSGFEKASCTALPSDVVEIGARWGSNRVTPSSFKVKAYVTEPAKLHHIDVVAA